MKALLALFLVFAVVLMALLYQRQSRQVEEQRAQLAAARQELGEAEAQARREQELRQGQSDPLAEPQASLAETPARLTPAPPAVPPPPPPAQSRGPMADLLKDPQMKAMMQKQATAAMERKIQQILTPDLIRQLNLNDERAAGLRALLVRKETAGMDFLMSMMTSARDDPGLAEAGRKARDGMTDADTQIKSFLGETDYPTFEWYEKSQPERERLVKFRAQCAQSQMDLQPAQQEQLLAAMFEERVRFPFSIDFDDPAKFDVERIHDYFSEENFQTHFQELEQVNERIAQRAQAFLTPEQLAQFKTMQAERIAQSKLTVKTTHAMLGPGGKGAK
jgi:hypothetical protein